jgi:predicted negative regulator of RcsB-dependent stress response
MSLTIRFLPILAILLTFTATGSAQVAAICGETGSTPWMNTSFVYGKVQLKGFDVTKLPKITIVLADRRGSESRYTIDRSGNYCFRNIDGSGGFLVIEVEGLEVVRRSLPSGGSGPVQHRQDFEIQPTHPERSRPPATISAKYNYPRSARNNELFDEAVLAERGMELGKAAQLLKEIVANDPADFVAFAKLGSVYFDQKKISESEASYSRALALRADYVPAIINLGRIRLIQKKFDDAIATFEKATAADPSSARAFQLLGEAYLLVRKGTLGVAALNEAIRLDPVGMAECHLLMARLYDLAGAKPLASREYRIFLEKVPGHQDKKRFEQYIKDNPEEP